jgi:hypothetical protein
MTDAEMEEYFYAKYYESLDSPRKAGRPVGQGYGGITHPSLYNVDTPEERHERAMLFAMRAIEEEAAERSALLAGDAESPEGADFAALIREEFGI